MLNVVTHIFSSQVNNFIKLEEWNLFRVSFIYSNEKIDSPRTYIWTFFSSSLSKTGRAAWNKIKTDVNERQQWNLGLIRKVFIAFEGENTLNVLWLIILFSTSLTIAPFDLFIFSRGDSSVVLDKDFPFFFKEISSKNTAIYFSSEFEGKIKKTSFFLNIK